MPPGPRIVISLENSVTSGHGTVIVADPLTLAAGGAETDRA
jgi:hypothetical protein